MKTRNFTLPFLLLLCGYFSAKAQPAKIGDSLGHMLVQQSPINPWHSGKSDSCFELISFPDDYNANPTKKYPVLFFFHGLGEAGPADGSQLSKQLNNALPQFISQGLKPSALAEDGNLYKFIVVMPQRVGGSIDINQLYYILPDILKKVRADTTRLYITGLSYGGYGTWSCMTDNGTAPFQGFIKKFAAILPQSQVALDQSVNTGNATGYNRVAHVKDAAADSLPVLIVCGDADDKWQYAKAYRDSINNHNPYIPAILINRPGQAHTASAWDSIYSPTFRPSEIGGKNGYEWLIQYTTTRGYLTGHGAPPPPPPPGPPSANAGTDVSITLPTSSVTLNGSGSETNGTIVGYTWTQVSGPSTAAFVSATSATTAATGLVQGVYTFQLTVKDNSGVTATDVVKVTVNAAVVVPGPPSANAGADVSITLPTSSVTLTGSGSETNGTIVGYTWTQVSGPSTATIGAASSATTGVSGLAQGAYVFQLTVKDNSGVTASDVVKVTVNPAVPVPGTPVVDAGANQTITLPTSSVTLTATASETNGTIVSYAWTQLSGPSTAVFGAAVSATTGVSGLAQGVYSFQVTVKDNSGVTASDFVKVTVNPAPVVPGAPLANAGTDFSITLPTNSVTLSGSGSETNGTIVSYAWTQVNGPSTAVFADASQAVTSASELLEGVYLFQLTIKDNSGVTAFDQVKVTVNAAPGAPVNQPPVADAGPDMTIEQTAAPVTLDGSASHDPDGTIVKYQWVQTAGLSGVTLTNAGSAKPAAYGMNPGSYVFQLTVTDDKGATGQDEVMVTVKAATATPPGGPTAPAAPVASAGAPVDTVTLPANQVNLDGSSSTGDIVSYQWTQMSGPASAVMGNAGAANTAASGLVAGTYIFQLTVKDSNGATATTIVKVVVLNDTKRMAQVKSVELYPNPARDVLNIKYESEVQEQVSMTVYTIGGVRVLSASFSKSSGAASFQLKVASLGKGVYGLKIVGSGGGKEMRMFVKQ
ncbi:MAG: T9SS type A sorting domain-containing protein [Bacteroidetes bacterium]|nr:T9SS type A sorting domain-containing protein [Bacteroidota bacterium]